MKNLTFMANFYPLKQLIQKTLNMIVLGWNGGGAEAAAQLGSGLGGNTLTICKSIPVSL